MKLRSLTPDVPGRRQAGFLQFPFQAVVEVREVLIHSDGILRAALSLIVQRHQQVSVLEVRIHEPGQHHDSPSHIACLLRLTGSSVLPLPLTLMLCRFCILLCRYRPAGPCLSLHHCHFSVPVRKVNILNQAFTGQKAPFFLTFTGPQRTMEM